MKNALRFKSLLFQTNQSLTKPKLYFARYFSEGKSDKSQKDRLSDTEKFTMDTQKLMPSIRSEKLEVSSHNKEISDEYTPEYFKMYSSRISDFSFLDEIPHNTEIDKVQYLYGMPIKNSTFNPRSQLTEVNSTSDYDTATESLMSLLQLDKDSSYESL
jgi:hypothetical protein